MARWARFLLPAAVMLLVFLVASACAPAAPPAPAAPAKELVGEIKIGLLLPLTGRIAAEGNRQLAGFEIVRDMINDWGGIAGKKLTFVVADGPDPTAAASEAGRLITAEKVKLITGTYSSSLCVPASEVTVRAKVTYWEVSCVDPRFNERGLPYVWRTEIDALGFGWYSTEFIAKTLAPKLGIPVKDLRISFIAEDSAYGMGTTEYATKKRAPELGFQVLSVDYYNAAKMTDFTPLILKLKTLNPDILHFTPYTQDAILFWKQAREQDLYFKALVHTGAVGFGSPDFGEAFKKDADGPFALLEPVGLKLEALTPEGAKWEAEFHKRYQAKYGMRGPGAAQLSAAGLQILKYVLDKTGGDLDPDKITKAAMELDLPIGTTINGWGVKFQQNGQNRNEIVQHYMNQWQDGKLVTAWPDKFAIAPMKMIPLPKWAERK